MEVDTSDEHAIAESADTSVIIGENGMCQTPASSSTTCRETPDQSSTMYKMLSRVANTDAHFRHQQRGEPDLTVDEKIIIAGEVLDLNPGTFLSRYGKYLATDDLSYFDGMCHDYTVNFYMQEIKKRLVDSKNKVKVRNRRYEAMKQLIDRKDYFSDHEMKARDPLLYEQMIGQYLTEDEVMEQSQKNIELSSVLFNHIEAIHNNELYAKQLQQEESQLEEGDSDEESEVEEDMEDDEDKPQVPAIPDEERHLLRQEFTAIMQQRFIHGQDADFDYQEVDENVEYDSLDIRTQDEEEKYFDEEDAISVQSQSSSIDGGMEDCSGFKHMQLTDIGGESSTRTSKELASGGDMLCCGEQTYESVKRNNQTMDESVEQTSQNVNAEQTTLPECGSEEKTIQSDSPLEPT